MVDDEEVIDQAGLIPEEREDGQCLLQEGELQPAADEGEEMEPEERRRP